MSFTFDLQDEFIPGYIHHKPILGKFAMFTACELICVGKIALYECYMKDLLGDMRNDIKCYGSGKFMGEI